jgi:predicted small lipoprotein YifL
MRALILITALALAGCGGNGPANNAAVAEETSADEVTAANDATAIDAATGEAADMAADVNYTLNEAEFNELANDAAANGGAAANNSL